MFKIAKHESLALLQKFSQQTAKVKCDEFMSSKFELFNESVSVKFQCSFNENQRKPFKINLF